MILRSYFAFLTRDLRQTLSYRFAFFLDIAGVFFNAATFYFMSRLIDPSAHAGLSQYGGDYFPFVLIGIAFSTYQTAGLTSFSQSLRQEQFVGTMESVLVSPIRIPTFLSGSALWDFLYATVEVAFYFILAFAIFGVALPNAAVLPALAALILTLSAFMGLGVLAAAFILRFKRGNPVAWLIATASELLGGVYFPVNLLPDWLKGVAEWVPMKHALDALRGSLLLGHGFDRIGGSLLFLGIFSFVAWAAGIGAFSWALKKAQDDGTLGHY